MESVKERRIKFDRFAFWVHFFFGFLLGSAIGMYAWGRSQFALSGSMLHGFWFIAGGGLLVGVGAGFYQEEFWESVGPGLQVYKAAVVVVLAVVAIAVLCFVHLLN